MPHACLVSGVGACERSLSVHIEGAGDGAGHTGALSHS